MGLRRTPFIRSISQFTLKEERTKETVISLLKETLHNNPERLDSILLKGTLARLGDLSSLESLIDEYQNSLSISTRQEEHFRDYIFEELCKINEGKAAMFIIEYVQETHDITLKLAAIGTMLEANNPYALKLARKSIQVESDAFDLIEAQLYLQAIIAFSGNPEDRGFLDSLSKVSEQLFGTDTAEELRPLIIQAYENIKVHN